MIKDVFANIPETEKLFHQYSNDTSRNELINSDTKDHLSTTRKKQ